ncbi:MAG: hypothetical protein D6693_05375 [Planctomycetota bacterium]|nr:MAG: hypothetical protein D6693_05375 [Planctomycetota bacterium]
MKPHDPDAEQTATKPTPAKERPEMSTLAITNTEFTIAIVGMGFTLVLLGVIFRFVKWDEARKAALNLEAEREQTHREIAAHVAAGALSTDDAERLIHAMWEADDASIDKARRALASAPTAAATAPAPARPPAV